ncbi:DUF1656 domain-containing protein [Myxococcus sp. K15C18031901]|uniref:DUF1656 domain-containing protein n=1 Tax=Myxococcus dinghuensis TaxID=2906761 RepID=UPI0020A82102|nr:DUF1656 domain-containing protein [Myxococcus dinghuensis]MCP3102091.1 DUF1656 domain-containing protein [Myxococcus dinghuensis]
MGVYLPFPFVAACIAGAVFFVLRKVLSRAGFYRHVWHPALADLALYILLMCATVFVSR